MTTNPMDGYRDIHPWPYSWSRDIADVAVSALATAKFVFEDVDWWTYDNHWSWGDFPPATPADHCVDIFWSDDTEERLQLPPPIGDIVVSLLVAQHGDAIKLMIWFGHYWTALTGWQPYEGPQGDFVDHIHVEFKPE